MSELKPGDVVWIREQLVNRPDGATDPDDAVFIDWGGVPMWAEPRFVIPDVPNLATVARVLAAHPGIGEAIVTISGIASDTITSAAIRARANGGRLKTLDEYQQAQGMVDALAAALNGGTE